VCCTIQGLELDESELEELSQGGMMDADSKSRRSKGFAGDLMDVFNALKGGAHITRRKDGSI
jgi:hypothetical protein